MAGRAIRAVLLLFCALAASACDRTATAPADPRGLAWSQVLQQARGQEVVLQMWQGDPQVNAYLRDFVVPKLRDEAGVALRLVPGQGDAIVTSLMTQAEAGSADSLVDMVWINGETFYQLRQIHALYGPFTERLPNAQYIDWDSPFIARDFQQPVDGYECPWGNVQLLLIADRARVPVPPATAQELAAWIHAHPGRFTFDTGFTGMSFLKSLLFAFAASPRELAGAFDETRYLALRERVFAWVQSVRGDLWRRGRTFPVSVAQLNELFVDGEVDFSMSFNDGQVANKIATGLFPPTAFAFALRSGTIRNSHYLGIAARSPHKAGALVVANFLISPQAQYEKLDPVRWGDGTVLQPARLPGDWRDRFAALGTRRGAPARAELDALALPEPAPEVMMRISADFRKAFLSDAP